MDDYMVNLAAEIDDERVGNEAAVDRSSGREEGSVERWRIQLLLCLWLLTAIVLPLTICLGRLLWSEKSSVRCGYMVKLLRKIGGVLSRAVNTLHVESFEADIGIVVVSPQSLVVTGIVAAPTLLAFSQYKNLTYKSSSRM